MLGPDDLRATSGQFVPDHGVHGVRQKVWHSVAVDVYQFASLARIRPVDRMFDPRFRCVAARVFYPGDALSKVVASDDVDVSVPVDVEWTIGEIFIVMWIRAAGRNC